MANLESRADKAVRDAVDAFMDGRLVPRFEGEVVFETKNSRYRLLDGVVFAAPDSSLVGAELVGWLSETARRCIIEWSWQPGSRAVLVDRKRGRNIIVTSTTRLMHQEEQAPPSFQREPEVPHHNDSWSAPPFRDEDPAPAPAFSARRAAIVASTPPPAQAFTAQPAAEPPLNPAPPPPPAIPRAPLPFGSERQVRVPAPSPPRRAAAVHAPPRPVKASTATAAPRLGSGVTPLPHSRPLPFPARPPPRRASPAPPAFTSTPGAQVPARPFIPPPPGVPRGVVAGATSAPSDWELTSAEFEMETDTDEPPTDERPQVGPSHYNATRHPLAARDPGSPPLPHAHSHAQMAADDAMDPVNSEPFPLLQSMEQRGEPSGSVQVPPRGPGR